MRFFSSVNLNLKIQDCKKSKVLTFHALGTCFAIKIPHKLPITTQNNSCGEMVFKNNPSWVLVLFFLFLTLPVHAAGTAAGTVISNIATVDYSIDSVVAPAITSAPATIVVDELIDLTLTWQDGAPVSVSSPDTNDALTFLLTSTGNGPEAFSLARNNALPGDNYNPANGSAGTIFMENGLAPGFQSTGPNADTLYIPGGNDPNLAAGSSQIVYVVSNTPGALTNGNTGLMRLDAASLTPGAPGAVPGTGLPGLGQGGVTAVVGITQARAQSTGSYLVSGMSVVVAKSVLSVLDPRGGTDLMPGAILTYRIQVTLSGAGTADNLVISDPLPVEVTYAPNSITVGGIPRTDTTDADNAQFAVNTLTVSLGNIPAPASFTIEFRAALN